MPLSTPADTSDNNAAESEPEKDNGSKRRYNSQYVQYRTTGSAVTGNQDDNICTKKVSDGKTGVWTDSQ